MEHRWNQRVSVTARAVVHRAAFGSHVGNVSDASSGGAYIELTRSVCPLNSLITVLLAFESDDRAPLLQLPGMVVRADDHGIGVMFLEHDTVSARNLQRWLTSARAPFQVQAAEIVNFTRVDVDHGRAEARSR